MGAADARYALEMSTVIAGSREEMRKRPNFSMLVCTIAPLVQDRPGIEAAMVLAEAGVPVGFLSMPTLGLTPIYHNITRERKLCSPVLDYGHTGGGVAISPAG